MSIWSHPRGYGVLLAMTLGVAAPTYACGPEFPNRLLDDRGATLQQLPEGTFLFEATRLVAVTPDALVEGDGQATPERTDSPAAQDYARAAHAFHAGDFAAARDGFSALLARALDQQEGFRPAARFSLGRSLRALGDGAGAEAAFRRVREDVLAGQADPAGLGLASFGEEARLRLESGDARAAVHLYAEQAARGSASGSISLLQVARRLMDDAPMREAALADPLVQRLLAAYLYTRASQIGETRVAALLDSLEARGLATLDGADRLAAVAYRGARYELAGQLAERSQTALAWWVRAKLALRAGDDGAARAAYAKAAQGFPQEEDWSEGAGYVEAYGFGGLKPRCRVQGENAILALKRGDYVDALELLYSAGDAYWDDTAFVAERVLTPDELKAFVDAHVAAVHVPPVAPEATDEEQEWAPLPVAQRLRSLLGRRLLRAGRGEAVGYFDDPALAAKAQRYVDVLAATQKGGRIARAEALFGAGRIARVDGMQLLGFEGDPDYAMYDGNYDLAPAGHYDEHYTWIAEPRKDVELPHGLAGPDEGARLRASRAEPLHRFHYRHVAVAFANQAADLLPVRSQAFVAVLCAATGWVNARDPALGRTLWWRYVNEGAYVPWAADFGNTCEPPDFPAAQARLDAERMATLRRWARLAAPYALGLGVLIVAGIVLLRRQRQPR